MRPSRSKTIAVCGIADTRRLNLWSREIIIIALAVALSSTPAFSSGVVCNESGIKGYDAEALQAERYLPPFPTSSLEATTFYLTVQGGSLYVHSNYKTVDQPFVTKLATDEAVDLENVVGNIGNRHYGAETALRSASFVVDESLLKSSKWSALDFSEVGSLSVVKDGKPYPARSFRADGEEPRWVLEYGRGVYVDAAKNDGATLVEALRQQPFAGTDIHLISFSLNSATVDRVKSIPNAITFSDSSPDALAVELKKHTERTLFVLGHIEDGVFVTRDAANKEVFRIGVSELEDLAFKCCKIRLFAVGCHSANSVSRGMLETFNTLKALDRYEQGLKATTMLGFLEAMAGEDPRLALVVDSALLTPLITTEVRVIASKDPRSKDAPIRGQEVARIWYSAPPLPAQPTGPGTNPFDATSPEETDTWGCGCVVVVLIVIVVLFVVSRRILRRRKR